MLTQDAPPPRGLVSASPGVLAAFKLSNGTASARRAGVEPHDHQRDERRRLQHMAEANRARRDEQPESQQVEDRQ